MIDTSIFQVSQLVEDVLGGDNSAECAWRLHCEIVPRYVPPNPRPDTKPRCVVRCGESFLRHSAGPRQHHFWDCYGDDYLRPELALVALSQAPPPPRLMAPGFACPPREWDAMRSSEARAATVARLRQLVAGAFEPAAIDEVPNEYCGCEDCAPWVVARTEFGDVKVGWRKRVVSIDWGGTGVCLAKLFEDQDVTKSATYVHAWGYDKAAEYLKRLADALASVRGQG